LFGGADKGIPREDVERFREALDDAGVPNEIVVYEGAPHSFFDRTFEQHREASDDAWRRILGFVGSGSALA
jgi:carboxymethylenebutenolidase